MNEIMKFHKITNLGCRDYDDMVVTLKVNGEWVDIPMHKEGDCHYIIINEVKIYINDLYELN